MWEKSASLLLVIGAATWFGHSPSWEPALLTLSALIGLGALERRDRNRLRRAIEHSTPTGPPQEHLDHDRALFRRYDDILTEQRLRDELNGGLYNGYTTSAFLDALDGYQQLGALGDGKFLIEGVQVMMVRLQRRLARLRDFVGRKFFMSNPRQDDRMFLQPELKYGAPDVYDELRDELKSLLDEAEAAYVAFRNEVKSRLAT